MKRNRISPIEYFRDLIALAKRKQVTGDSAGAISEYRRAASYAKRRSLCREVLIAKAAAFQAAGKPDQAILALDQAIATGGVGDSLVCFFMGWRWANELAYEAAILNWEKSLNDPLFNMPGYAWNDVGVAYLKLGCPDKAIEAFEKALAAPNYPLAGITWNNLGNAHALKANFEKAILCYQTALVDTNHKDHGRLYHDLGVAFEKQEKSSQAIECFEVALQSPSIAADCRALLNLGAAYANAGRTKDALTQYQKALNLPNGEIRGEIYGCMATAYALDKNDSRAAECWESAAKFFDEEGKPEEAARARQSLNSIRRAPGQRSDRDRSRLNSPAAIYGNDGYFTSPIDRLRDYQTSFPEDDFSELLKRPSSGLDDVLAILRNWGSVDAYGRACGGGFFLKWRSKGIAIDPGFDFFRNFREQFHPREIDAVLVSHNHPDHNGDLGEIDDHIYELARRAKSRANGEENDYNYTIIWDQDTAAVYRAFGDQRFSQAIDPITFDLARWRLGLERSIDLQRTGLPFTIHYFPVQHSSDVRQAVGFRIQCHYADPEQKPLTIGFSCDTGYFADLCEMDYLRSCDLLILNMSEPDKAEFDDRSHFKKKHLGLNGCRELILRCEPKLTIISEFWPGRGDKRIALVQSLRQDCDKLAILPGSNGLLVGLGGNEFPCRCPRDGWRPKERIRAIPPPLSEPYGKLIYGCPDCII